MKIILYAKTDLGKLALKAEFSELRNMMSAEDKAALEKLFDTSFDPENGMVAMKSIHPAVEYVQPWAIVAKIEQALLKEGAIKNVDYKVVLE